MALVEGVGDEVLLSFVLGILLIIILFIWGTDFFRSFSNLSQPHDNTSRPESELREDDIHSNESTSATITERDFNVRRETIQELNEDVESNSSATPEPSPSTNENVENNNSNIQTDKPSTDSDEPSADDPEALRIKRLEFFNKKPGSSAADDSEPSSSKTKTPKTDEPNVKCDAAPPVTNGHMPNIRRDADIDANSTNGVNSSEAAQGYFNIRLKSLDDTERLVRGKADQLIRAFKREYFGEDVASSRIVRLIYNGQVLQDQQTLGGYNISDGCVVHVQISNPNLNSPPTDSQSDSELDLGQFFWPLLGVLLGIVWMLYFQYKEYFNASSTIALLGLSGLFLTIVWGQYARPPEQV